MASTTWSKLQNLPGVRDLYGPHFPMEARHFYAEWLEAQVPRLYVPRTRRGTVSFEA